jgi:hypothetical protein
MDKFLFGIVLGGFAVAIFAYAVSVARRVQGAPPIATSSRAAAASKRFGLAALHFAGRVTDTFVVNGLACLLVAGLVASGWMAHAVHSSDEERSSRVRHMKAQAEYFEAMTAQMGRTFPGPEVYTPAAPDRVDEPTPAEPQSRLRGN